MEFEREWRELGMESRKAGLANPPGGLVRRLVSDSPSAEVHLAVSFNDGLCAIMIAMPEGWTAEVSHLPRWSGMRPAVAVGTERPKPRRFLVLRQGPGSPAEVFHAIAADLVGALQLAPADRAERVLTKRLERWKAFFEHAGARGLGPEAQQGLFGELWLLGKRLIPLLGAREAVGGWTGPQRANHDFQFGRRALEVKTSTAKQHQKIHVSSERQLSTSGLSSLVLVFLSFAASDGGGTTLPEQVVAIRGLLGSEPAALRVLEEKLIEAGYTDAHAEMYKTGYALRSVKNFEVTAGFPRIKESDLPAAIGDLSYSVVVSACEPFKVADSVVWERLKAVEDRKADED